MKKLKETLLTEISRATEYTANTDDPHVSSEQAVQLLALTALQLQLEYTEDESVDGAVQALISYFPPQLQATMRETIDRLLSEEQLKGPQGLAIVIDGEVAHRITNSEKQYILAATVIDQSIGTYVEKVTERLNKSNLGKQRKEDTGNPYSVTEVHKMLESICNGGSNNTLQDLVTTSAKGRIELKENVAIKIPVKQLTPNSFEVLGQEVVIPKVAAAVLEILLSEPTRVFASREMAAAVKSLSGGEIASAAVMERIQSDLTTYVLQFQAGVDFSPVRIEVINKEPRYSFNTDWYQAVE